MPHIDESSPLAAEIAATPLLTREQELALARRCRAGDAEARDLLVRANIRLAMKVASWFRASSLSFEDLVMEAVQGLVIAADRFDPERGFKFSTFAVWWCKNRCSAAIGDRDAIVRRPRGHTDRTPLVRASLDAPLGPGPGDDQGVRTLGDLVAEDGVEQPADTIMAEESRRRVHEALDRLPRRDAEVLRLRHGVRADGGAGAPLSLGEVGRLLRVSRERVRQLESRALARLAKRLAAKPHAVAAS